jgi:Endonuclease/Exonuclease/phosphatase family
VSPSQDVVVANFNIHAGIDGWGREFDAVGACLGFGADVLVIEEDWVGDDPCESIGARIARDGGYEIITAPLSQARRRRTTANTTAHPKRWQPRLSPGFRRPLLLDGPPGSRRARITREEPSVSMGSGSWATSVLSRLPVLQSESIDLPLLHSDPARRKAIVATLSTGGQNRLTVIGAHLGHLTQGSPRQMRALRHHVANLPGPTVLVGDLNCWGPPLRVLMHGLHDSVRGPTWPAWRPHSRIDHILVSDLSLVRSSAVLKDAGSDHLPIRCLLRMP